MLARFGISRTVFVGALEVLEHELDGLQGKAVCKVVRQYGNVCFYGVGQYVQTGIGGYACRHGHGKCRIDNRNGRCQRVVGNRIFLSPSLMTVNGVTSEPVPDVVGMPINLALRPNSGKRNARCGCP